ncbi:hypothetical protein R3W88_010225 [Solanum pinnatisectum]|uniref:RNase H type-1 domain-containing protein n=1 Tax=Solanum pinnatisectum TaxID=50273 RepID=A0AAV9MG18_9SOLN|nr:hypothetical protein R3W88_010225 [Solanum pinnatisectum]
MPREGWVTCNTDGASKGNPSQSAYGFCIRNRGGDLIYAEAQSIGEATNMEAEVRAVWEALKYCISERMRKQVFLSFNQLPSLGRKILNMNKLNPFSSFQIKKNKHGQQWVACLVTVKI